ncbi:MAG: CPBP family intramembrane metalloprotease [Lachnospiraceae bacterium]|nr:CPBP family intramembrane metalloprotease [Lachnospiraceae bacterium]
MNSKKSGLLFLTITIIFVAIELTLAYTPLGDSLDETALMILSELAFMVPVAVFFVLCREPASKAFAVKGVKISSLILCIPFTWTILPLTLLLNVFSMLFTDNRATKIFESLSGGGFFKMALFAAVIAPICEELTFRGIIFSGFRKNGSALQAILISALLFGLFHMNINQALYAFALGVFFGAVREVSGSVIPSIVCHMTVNGGSVLSMYLEKDQLMDKEVLKQSEALLKDPQTVSLLLAVFTVAAFIGVAFALCMLTLIAKKQNAVALLRGIIDNEKTGRGRVWGIPLIAGMILATGYMIFVYILELTLKKA